MHFRIVFFPPKVPAYARSALALRHYVMDCGSRLDLLPIVDEDKRRDSHAAEPLRHVGMLFGVDLSDAEIIPELLRDSLELRWQQFMHNAWGVENVLRKLSSWQASEATKACDMGRRERIGLNIE